MNLPEILDKVDGLYVRILCNIDSEKVIDEIRKEIRTVVTENRELLIAELQSELAEIRKQTPEEYYRSNPSARKRLAHDLLRSLS